MPKPAVAVAPSSDLGNRLESLGRQIGYGRGLRPNRTQIVAVGLVILAFWLVVVFGKALGQLNDATQRQAVAAADTQALQLQLDSGKRELMLVQTDAFQALQARSLGMGGKGEQVFALTADAPPPPAIIPLGRTSATVTQPGPLEAWLQLLFGN
jgi:hypothetical protein